MMEGTNIDDFACFVSYVTLLSVCTIVSYLCKVLLMILSWTE